MPSGTSDAALAARAGRPAPAASAAAPRADVRLVPAAWGADDGSVRLLAAMPRLATGAAAAPVALRIALSRRPDPAEPNASALVASGRLSLDVTVEPGGDALAAAERRLGRRCAPLLVRRLEVALEAGLEGRIRSIADASAAGPRLRLGAELSRGDALAALRAARGERSGLRVRARVTYDARDDVLLELEADASAVRAFLEPHANRASQLSGRTLGPLFEAMLAEGVLAVNRGRGLAPVRPDLLPLYGAFLPEARGLLDPLPSPARLDDASRVFALGLREGPIRARALAPARVPRSVELAASLDAVLAGAAAPVTLEAPDPADPSRLAPLPERVERARERAAPPARGERERVSLVTVGGPRSLALALGADRGAAPAAHALLASSVVHPAAEHVWLAHDLVFDPGTAAPVLPLPLVDDPAAPLWVQRGDASKHFYAPAFELVRPQAADAPETSAFLFRFAQTGVTGGPSPRPGLHGEVRFTLRAVPSEATRAALAAAGQPAASPVPMNALSATLEVPFRAEGTGETRSQIFAASATLAGDLVTVEAELLDDWVRLLYGALAYEGFQAAPVRISLAYSFPAWQPVSDLHIDPALTDKWAITPLVPSPPPVESRLERAVVHAGSRTVYLPGGGRLLLGIEPRTRGAALSHASPQLSHVGAAVHVADVTAHVPPAPLDVSLVPIARFATRTVVHGEWVDATLACRDFGNFYVQASEAGDAPVGCRDALKLGEIVYRQYEEIGSLRAPAYQVWRSLQQPGRFLVVPTAYRVTRYAATEPPDRAFRPVLMIYAQLGPTPADARYLFAATLEPDVPYAARRELEYALAALSPAGSTPALDYPTDPVVSATATFAWAVPDGVQAPQVAIVWNGLQIGVATDLGHGVVLKELLEHSGLAGSATFTLADGTVLRSQLVVDTGVIGPWIGGPVTVTRDGARITVRNAVAQPVDVGDVVVVRASLRQRLPLGARLAPGEARTLDAGAPVDDAWAEARAAGGATLEELEIFEEDVKTNVVFANQVNYANHGLAGLSLSVRIRGTEHVTAAVLPEGQTAAVDLVFPLTRYLDAQVVEFQVTKTYTAGEGRTTAWIAWDLGTQGAVVGVTSKLIEEEG